MGFTTQDKTPDLATHGYTIETDSLPYGAFSTRKTYTDGTRTLQLSTAKNSSGDAFVTITITGRCNFACLKNFKEDLAGDSTGSQYTSTSGETKYISLRSNSTARPVALFQGNKGSFGVADIFITSDEGEKTYCNRFSVTISRLDSDECLVTITQVHGDFR